MRESERSGGAGQGGADPPETRLLERVRSGMTVTDAAGKRVGRVEDVVMGDPEAVTTEGNEPRRAGGVIGALADAVADQAGEPDVPEPQRSQLLRLGYVKVDGPGFLGHDRYVRADQIREVSRDAVSLAVRRDEVPRES